MYLNVLALYAKQGHIILRSYYRITRIFTIFAVYTLRCQHPKYTERVLNSASYIVNPKYSRTSIIRTNRGGDLAG